MVRAGIYDRDPIVGMVGITKHFGGVYAVKHADLELYEGEILALVGDNAAGHPNGGYIKGWTWSPLHAH